MNTATHTIGYGLTARLLRALHLLAQPAPIVLALVAIWGASFALLRDALAPGIPDSQAIPFAAYPGFAIDYSSGVLGLLNNGALMFLFCISASMLIMGGLLISYFAANRVELFWGAISAWMLIAATDIQVLFPLQGTEANIRSLVVVKDKMISWDVYRTVVGIVLLMVGVLVGYGLRGATHRHGRCENKVRQLSINQFRQVFIVLVIFLLFRAGFLIIRDLSGLVPATSSFMLYPWQCLTGNNGSRALGLLATVGLLTVGLVIGLLVRSGQKKGLAWAFFGMPSLVIIDTTLSMQWRLNSMEGVNVLPGMVLAAVVMGLASFLVALSSKSSRVGRTSLCGAKSRAE